MADSRSSSNELIRAKDRLPAQCVRDIDSLNSFTRSILGRERPDNAKSPEDFEHVLLTGATGFIGRFFLRELLVGKDNLIVHCLVRASTDSQGRERVQTALKDADLWENDFESRIRIVLGDVSDNQFGLEQNEFAALSEIIDAVYHLAAELKIVTPYMKIRRTNIFSIRNVIELCLTTRFKHLFFSSSMGVFPQYFFAFTNEFEDSCIEVEAQPDIDLMIRHFPLGMIGYPWSKLVSERALSYAHEAGMPLAIFRLPLTAVSANGYTHFNGILTRLLAAIHDVGKIPVRPQFRFISEPVDVIAKIAVSISSNTNRRYTIYHVCDPDPVRHRLTHAEYGHHMQVVPYTAFKRACMARGQDSPLHGNWLLLDHVAPYWFTKKKHLDRLPISDAEIRSDCLCEIEWPSELFKIVRSSEWIHDPKNRWPYSLPKSTLDYDQLICQAKTYAENYEVKFEEVYPEWMRQGLRQWVRAVNASDLELLPSRVSMAVYQVCRLLRDNAAYARERNLYPEIKFEKINKPIFIVGMNRTGTTFLHRLMSRDQQFWSLRTFELVDSVLSDADYTVAGTQADPRRAFVEDILEVTGLRNAFEGLHTIDIDEPEEDIKLLQLAFMSWPSMIWHHAPEYGQWLEKTGSDNAYRHHYRIMQHYNWQRRLSEATDSSKQWIFKMPFHLMELSSLVKAYPDAYFIQTHRAPAVLMGSWFSLVSRLRSRNYKSQSPRELGIEQLNFMAKMMNRAVQFRTSHPELESRWIDIKYDDFVAAPMQKVAAIYERFGLRMESEANDAMVDWLGEQAKRRSNEVRHQYNLSDFSLTVDTVDAAFDHYLEFYAKLGV